MHAITLWAVPVAALSSFALGGLWFSPLAFGGLQEREMHKRGETPPPATAKTLLSSFALTLIEAFVFAWLLQTTVSPLGAVGTGLLIGSCFAAAGTGINYLYTGRGLLLWLVDGGFHAARFGLYGLVLGIWHAA